MSEERKYMSVKEFREEGYLQELNRRFLHPLGLALEVIVDEDGSEVLGGIWDYRDDKEGVVFGEGVADLSKAKKVYDEEIRRHYHRIEALGYWFQPVRG